MKGSYRITVSNTKIRYEFTIRRNITIIKGDSATGKTTLVEMIREFYENGTDSGISLQCEKTCRVLNGRDWKVLLDSMHESIIFIDEDNEFLPSNAFAETIKESDNYYVIVTREGLPNLPYSVDEIYGIRESGRYASLKQTYNELYHIYGRIDYSKPIKPNHLVTEDSNAGYEFFEGIDGRNYTVETANGKSNVAGKILDADEETLIIADGSAFGSEMDRAIKLMKTKSHVNLYLPESFEWLILESGLIDYHGLEKILEDPSNYIDSKEFFSWERYFNELLTEATRDSYMRYSKKKLNRVYLQKEVSERILAVMKDIEL